MSKEACNFSANGGGEGMKILVIIVGKVSHLGERKEKQILLNKQENGLEPLKINFIFFL